MANRSPAHVAREGATSSSSQILDNPNFSVSRGSSPTVKEADSELTAPSLTVGLLPGTQRHGAAEPQETTCARTGRACNHPSGQAWVASGSLRTYGDDERAQEVGQLRSTNEVCEQTDAFGQGGTDGGKAAGQGQCRRVQHVPGSVPDMTCQWH